MTETNTRIYLTAVLTACVLWTSGWPQKPARAQTAGHDPSGHHHAVPAPPAPGPAAARQPGPHGGQLAASNSLLLEVVYRPRETRVYLYDSRRRPVAARGVTCGAAMQVRGNEKVYRYRLRNVAPATAADRQDYLSLALDLSRIRDGNMKVTFELANLPDREQPQVTFTQTFAISKSPLQIAVVRLTDADRAGIARQAVCPVMGTKLGEHGTPLKVLVGSHTLYLCCKGCLPRVQKNPEAYLPKTAAVARITSAKATAADQAAIRAQVVCPVMGTKLGDHGTPLKVTIDGRALYLCCKGCLARVQRDPAKYLAKVSQPRSGQ